MKIARQSGGNCVARGLSTMRLALGYAEPTPEYVPGYKHVHEILTMLPDWFPEHEFKAWCSDENARKAGHPSWYASDIFPDSFDCDDALVAFAYYVGDASVSHFVIGVPSLYGDMRTSLIIAVMEPNA